MASSNDCVFCRTDRRLTPIVSNTLAFAIRDKFPVRPLQTLIIPHRHCETVFEATPAEREAMHQLAVVCRDQIRAEDATVGGFNFGSNMGVAAGQKIFHAHLHLIPRRSDEGSLPVPTPDRCDQAG